VISAVVAAFALAGMASANAGSFRVSMGAEYTTGDYGTADSTDIWYFPATFRHESDRGVLRLTVPYIIVTGTGTVVPGGGDHHIVAPGRPTTTRVTESGLGDILVGASYYLVSETITRPTLDVTGRVKLGTADEERNLGTGETDYDLQLDLAKSRNRMLYFGTVGYRLLGDPPGTDLDDILFGYAGGQMRLDARRSAGLELYLAEAATPGGSSAANLTAYLNRNLDAKRLLQIYGLLGLSDGSADWGLGVSISLRQ
jgi:hypothetical protein